jgi:hypothetical protein
MSGAAALAAAKRRRSQPTAPVSKTTEMTPKQNVKLTVTQKQAMMEKHRAHMMKQAQQNNAQQNNAQQNNAQQNNAPQNNAQKNNAPQNKAQDNPIQIQHQNDTINPKSPLELLQKHDKAIHDLHVNQDILHENMVELKNALEKAMDIRNILSDIIFKPSYMEEIKQRISALENMESELAKKNVMSAFQNTIKKTDGQDIPLIESNSNNNDSNVTEEPTKEDTKEVSQD